MQQGRSDFARGADLATSAFRKPITRASAASSSSLRRGFSPRAFNYVERVMRMLRAWDVPPKKMRVYVLIGNEPYAECMGRIREVLEWGGEPHVQAYIKLNAPDKTPHARFDWTVQKLKDVERWANKWVWRKGPFEDYDRFYRSNTPPEVYDAQQGLFA